MCAGACAEGSGTGTELARLGAELIPAMKEVPHQSLQGSADKLWYDAVAVPLDRGGFAIPPPLPKATPNLVFGFSEAAFDAK